MFFKRKCPKCGMTNDKSLSQCLNCGALLNTIETKMAEKEQKEARKRACKEFQDSLQKSNEERKKAYTEAKSRVKYWSREKARNGLLTRVSESMRNKTRDELCAHLKSLGIDAQMAQHYRQEEDYDCSVWGGRSLGLIDIFEGPIRWVTLITGSGDSGTWYLIKYGIPDSRVALNCPKVQLYSNFDYKMAIREWKGEDSNLGILQRLNENILSTWVLGIKIHAYSKST